VYAESIFKIEDKNKEKVRKLFLRGVVKNIASNDAVFVNFIAIPSRCIK